MSVSLFADDLKTNNTAFSGGTQLMRGISKYSSYLRGVWKGLAAAAHIDAVKLCCSHEWVQRATDSVRQMYCCPNREQYVNRVQ